MDSDVKWIVTSRRNGARLVAFPPQLALRSGRGIGEFLELLVNTLIAPFALIA